MKLFKKIFKPKLNTLTEKSRAVGLAIGEVVEKGWEIDADRNEDIDTGEILSFASVLITETLKVFGDAEEGLKGIASPAGRDAFLEGFKEGFDLREENDDKEAAVEGILTWVDQGFDIFAQVRNAFAPAPE